MNLEKDFLLKLAVNLDRESNAQTIERLKDVASGKITNKVIIKNILLDAQYALTFLEKNKLLNELVQKIKT